MIRRQPRSKRRTPSFPTRLASDLGEEGVVADRLAQRLQGHPAPQVDAGGEELLAARLAWWVVDHVLAEAVVAPSRLRRRRSARALEEDPLGVGGEALVEPDVAPGGRAHRVAHPLVGQLGQAKVVRGKARGDELRDAPRDALRSHTEATRTAYER